MTQQVNLTPLQKDYACYLPAISSFYSTYVAKQRLEEFIPKDRIPAGFDRGVEGMNFLNPEAGYFTYKYGLYSAGHAQLDVVKAQTQESMIQQRDRGATMILGDSGGYQIGKGVLKFDWLNFEGPEATKTRQKILEWLEATADWSMMLDVPTWACDHIHSPKTGLKTFEDCLDKTRYNNDYFLMNRLGATKWLNVLQGSDWDTAERWYQGVKEFSDPKGKYAGREAEGWAMGGANMCKMPITLRRLITLKFDGLLEGKDWMHFLGTAQLDWACYLTQIQRQIRKSINPNFTISFDCASPFIATAHGLVYTQSVHTPKRWSVIMDKAPDNKAMAKSNIPFPFESAYGRRLTMGDICHYAPGMLNKIGKEGKTSWDSFAYALMMGHNVECHIVAVQRANQLMDIELARVRPNWRQWSKPGSKEAAQHELSDWVPRNILYFEGFLDDLFACGTKEQAFDLIKEADFFLKNLEGSRLRGGVTNEYNRMFVEVNENGDEIAPWEDDREDEELDKLEAKLNQGTV